MDDIDLYNLSQEIPTELSDDIAVDLEQDEEGHVFEKDSACLVEEHFMQAAKKCLDDFSLFTEEEFLAYMQNFPVVGLVKSLKERIYGYCSWFNYIYDCKIYYRAIEACELILDTDKVCLRLHFKLAKWYNIIIESKYFKRVSTAGSTEEAKQTSTTEEETQTDSEPNDTTASTARKGRPKSKPFEEMLVGTDEQKLRTRKRLHELMNGKSGKDAMRFINAAIKEGLLLSTVTPKALTTEFEGIGKESNCRKYKHIEPYAEAEIEAAIKRLTQD